MFKFDPNYLQEAKRGAKLAAKYIEKLHEEIRRLEEIISESNTGYISRLNDEVEDLEVEVGTLEAEVAVLQEENRELKLTVLKRNL